MSKHILIVDDDNSHLQALGEALSGAGFDVTTSNSGDMAKFIVQLQNFDVILSDIRMPEVDGLDLLDYVKSKMTVPVILMSGNPAPSNLNERGATAFLGKPFNKNDVLKAIYNAIEKNSTKCAIAD